MTSVSLTNSAALTLSVMEEQRASVEEVSRARDAATNCHVRCVDDFAWTVSWISISRIDQYPGRGSAS